MGPAAPPLAAAALAFADLVAAFFLMPETHAPAEQSRDATPHRGAPARILTALKEPRIATILVLYFLTFLSMTTLQVALPLLGEARLGWTSVDIGHVFAVFGLLGLVIQGLLLGWLAHRFGARNLVAAGCFASTAGLLTIAGAHGSVTMMGGLGLFGIGFGLTNPLLSTLASQLAGSERQGVILGFAQSSGGLARTLGPVACGVLYTHLGPASAFVGGACSAFAALVVAWVVRTRADRPPPAAGADDLSVRSSRA
jgi:predicted MFS family arabinose efflux permease